MLVLSDTSITNIACKDLIAIVQSEDLQKLGRYFTKYPEKVHAPMNAQHATLLHVAIRYECCLVVECLLAKKADPYIRDGQGKCHSF